MCAISKFFTSFILLGLFLVSLIPGSAMAENSPVLRTGILTDEVRDRTMEVWIWGPSDGNGTPQMVGGNDIFEPVEGIPGGSFTSGRHPLIVLFHGTGGNTRSMAWLSSELAKAGAIVVSANHPGSTTNEVTEESIIQTWHQAQDGTFLIDEMLRSEEFGALIDPMRIVSIGFSLGGYSALAVAGVEIRIEALQAFCLANPEEETCLLVGDALFGPLVADRIQEQHLGDARIRVAVGLAPGLVPAFDEASVSGINVPVLILAGTGDEMLPVANHARRLVGAFAHGSYIELGNTSHFSFLGLCTPDALEILSVDGEEFICTDPGAEPRRHIHDQITAYIVAFLTSHGMLEE